jgi:protein-S-isoprenylcysteine O-methyltransferase Ste14
MPVVTNVALALVFAVLAAAQLASGWRTGQWTTAAPLLAQQTVLVACFLTRRPSVTVSARPLDWTLALAGVLLPFFLRPADVPAGTAWLGRPLHAGGLALAAVATAFLGRSVGLVAANRGVRSSGPYRWVRHPMYLAQAVAMVGFVLCHATPWNVALLAAVLAAFYGRAVVEERVLAGDPAYRAYRAGTPWRFVPFVH